MKFTLFRIASLVFSSAVLLLLCLTALSGHLDDLSDAILPKELPSVNIANEKVRVILDAGHGGQDGGASSADGTLEKDLNLAVVCRTGDLLSACGYETLLTRSDDSMLGDGTAGHKKLADLRWRLDFANSHPDALLVSVHMNFFPQKSCRGIQLYYSDNDQNSIALAESLHARVKDLQPDNRREIKKALSNIYLLDRVQIPAVLIECGFLSNTEEAALLKSEDYQKTMSILILSSIDGYMKTEK